MGVATVKLSPAARAFRAGHAVIAVAFLLAIVYVWWCALTGRRDGWLRLAVVALVTEGALVVANRGDCPLGGLQDRLGDPVPLFELVLSPPAARRAVPALGLITAAGVIFALAAELELDLTTSYDEEESRQCAQRPLGRRDAQWFVASRNSASASSRLPMPSTVLHQRRPAHP